MGVEFTVSAGKHGFTEVDIRHAMEHALYFVNPFDSSRIPGRPDPMAWIGPASDGRLIEVLAVSDGRRGIIVFHAMEARPKTIHAVRHMLRGER